eukprot:GEZU01017178.1.p1 GENE.GEZU01017178.1~~GEZU01017178.1.p1  ORF type:complete len:179 (-),score=17.74 GEZU01017178.1:26-562(-)
MRSSDDISCLAEFDSKYSARQEGESLSITPVANNSNKKDNNRGSGSSGSAFFSAQGEIFPSDQSVSLTATWVGGSSASCLGVYYNNISSSSGSGAGERMMISVKCTGEAIEGSCSLTFAQEPNCARMHAWLIALVAAACMLGCCICICSLLCCIGSCCSNHRPQNRYVVCIVGVLCCC